MTAWIAFQTQKLQKRQTELFEHQVNNDLFPKRHEFYAMFVELFIDLMQPLPQENLEDTKRRLSDRHLVGHLFDDEVALNIQDLITIHQERASFIEKKQEKKKDESKQDATSAELSQFTTDAAKKTLQILHQITKYMK